MAIEVQLDGGAEQVDRLKKAGQFLTDVASAFSIHLFKLKKSE